jgi:flavorubredoxin
MEPSFQARAGVHVLPAYIPVPTIGLLPAHAFLVEAREPYLVDTGILSDSDAFVAAVEAILDPADLAWIYLTHTDPDHIGALSQLLERAPRAKVITTFIGLAKLQLGLRAPAPDRVRLANPGERIDLGDRTLSVMRPPLFDAPETTMVHDGRLGVLFSADTFGAPLTEPVQLANDLPEEELERSELLWATVDSPWIQHVDRGRFAAGLSEIVDLDPEWIFSAHLPPVRRMTATLCRNLARAPDAAPFMGPDQPAFEAILREAATPSAA